MNKILLFYFYFFAFSLKIMGQTGCPEVDAGEDQVIDCNTGNTVQLSATFLEIGETDRYIVEAIDYDPPFPINAGDPVNIDQDDTWSQIIDIPFNFCFYDNSYNQLLVGANGQITFDLSNLNQDCPYNLTIGNQPRTIPGNSVGVVNAIFGAMHDMDITIDNQGSFSYGIVGEAPCRSFIVNYNNIAHYTNNGACNNIRTTQQIVIYENTNAIDVYIRNKPVCTAFNNGYALIGILNETGSQAVTPFGRNTGEWAATEEAWRFIPSGDPVVTFSWLDEDGNVISSDADLTVNPTQTTTYTAEVVYTNCDGDEIIDTDEVIITVDNGGIEIEQPENLIVCVQDANDNQEIFDLTSQEDVINYTNDANLSITYHQTPEDASTGANPIPNPNSYENIANPQTIYASVLNTTNDCIQVVQFDLIINHPAEFTPIPDYLICDTDGNGEANFDLESLVDDIRVNPTDVITFHASESEAINGNNPLNSPYTNTSNPQTIYVRIDNGANCFLDIPFSFDLIVGQQPSIVNGALLEECSMDGTANFDLNLLDSQVTNDANITITYHATQNDADNGENSLSSPYNTGTTTVFVRVENADGCFSTVTAELIVNEIPNITPPDITECDDGSGNAIFDLDAYLTQLVNDNSNIDFSIHLTEVEAQNQSNPQTGILSSSGQTLWLSMINQNANECSNELSFDLIVQNEPGFNPIVDYELCDEDNDEVASFDLNSLIGNIQANANDIITFHESANDALNNSNPLASPYNNISNPQTIYVRVASASGCVLNTPFSFDLVVLEQPSVMQPEDFELCSGTNTATFDLNLLDDQVTSDTDVIISYHASQADAENNIAPLPSPYDTTSTTLFIRVENQGGCFQVIAVNLVVTNSPNITLQDFEACENTLGSNTAQFDLDVYLTNIQATYPTLELSIHLNEADADTGANPQTGVFTNSTNPETLWVAVVDPNAPECNDSFPFDLIVNPLPTISAGPFILETCDINENGIGEFVLTDADNLIDNTGNFNITYHPSEQDAEDNLNQINPDFSATASTVWARVMTDEGCHVTTSVDLIVNPLPIVNNTSDEVCSQTTVGQFNLNLLIGNIVGNASGVTLTFHDSLTAAEAGIDEISSPYSTQSTVIYARVENDTTLCFNIAEIDLTVIVAPDTTIGSFSNCEIANTDSSTFDLEELRSLIEADTGGTVTIHNSQMDAEDDLNPLAGNYDSSGETLWLKITTTIVDCDGIRPLELVMNDAPTITNYRVENCLLSENPNDFTFITTNLDPNFTYEAYTSFVDADNGTNQPITYPYTTSQDFTLLYVRVENRITGCHAVSELEFEVVDFFDNPLEPIIVCYGDTYTLPDGRVIPQEDGQYTYRNVENCSNDIYTFDFQVCNPEVYCRPRMPNAFSPNGSGVNDTFQLLEPLGCNLTIEQINIFNRWGETVYTATGNTFAWDGSFEGAQAQQGVYLWEIKYAYIDDQGNEGIGSHQGTIFLLR